MREHINHTGKERMALIRKADKIQVKDIPDNTTVVVKDYLLYDSSQFNETLLLVDGADNVLCITGTKGKNVFISSFLKYAPMFEGEVFTVTIQRKTSESGNEYISAYVDGLE